MAIREIRPTWSNIHNLKVYKLKSLRQGRNTEAKNIKKKGSTSNLSLIWMSGKRCESRLQSF